MAAVKPCLVAFCRDFALPNHPLARPAAVASAAAGMQGKFWEMHDYIFAHQKDMESLTFKAEQFEDYARALNLDVEKFKSDQTSDAVIRRVLDDQNDGEIVGVPSTPTFYLISPTQITRVVGLVELTTKMLQPGNPSALQSVT